MSTGIRDGVRARARGVRRAIQPSAPRRERSNPVTYGAPAADSAVSGMLRRPAVRLAVRDRTGAIALARRQWPIVAVMAAYVATAFVVPTMAPVPESDDWVYARSVEILVRQHHLKILDLSVATLVFQVLWGGLFAEIFGMSFGILRLATFALTCLGGLALYGLCRELGVSRGRSALGTAAYLFNPLAYSLGFSFMTDANFAALLVIATCFYARGLRQDRVAPWATVAGSAAAGAAFLVRQQGALIPIAIVVYLLAARRLRPDWASARLLARTVAVPALTMGLYYLWLKFIHGIPTRQDDFLRSVRKAGVGGTWTLIERLTFIEVMYAGFFALPIVAAALVGLPRLVRTTRAAGWVAFAVWETILVVGLAIFSPDGRRMPYIPHFLGTAGPGPGDLVGGRPWLINVGWLDWITAVCAVSSLALGFVLCRTVVGPANPTRAVAGMALAVGLWQVFGILPQSFTFRNWRFRGLPAPSLDRYLLPMLPFVICLGLWALRDVRFWQPAAWVIVGAFAVFAVAGTRDSLVLLQSTWSMARAANAQGIPNTRLDAGAGWDGYHLYDYSIAHHITHARTRNGPWWTGLFAPATDSTYVISTMRLNGFEVVERREYSAWLHRHRVYLYLLHRTGAPTGPPSRPPHRRGVG